MGYLLPSEYVEYGLTAETTDDWVTMASALIEAYCRRPSLMVTQYVERMRLTADAQTVRLSYRPLAAAVGATSALVGVRVRYGRPRRGELPDPFREQIAWAFSVPGSWSSLDATTVDVNQTTAELTFPLNFLGLGYDEVEVTYTSGVVTFTDSVKVACVQIVKNAQATPGMNVKSSKMDTLQMQYFSGSLIDPQVQMLLKPYVAERLGEAMAGASVMARRAADVLLSCAGGRAVLLRMPAPGTAGDVTEQLGLATPEFQDVELAPVVFRKARVATAEGKAAEWELMVSATAVNALVGSLGYSAASVLFADAFGVLVDGVLMEVEAVTESEVGGSPYVYRVVVKEPLALVV